MEKKASEWWSGAAVAEQAVYDSLQEIINCFKFRNENDHADQSEWAIDVKVLLCLASQFDQLCWWHMIDVALLRLQLGLCVMYSENGSTKVGLRLGESSPSAQQVQWSELWTYIHIILFIKCQHLLEYLKDLLFAAASGWFQALRRCDC